MLAKPRCIFVESYWLSYVPGLTSCLAECAVSTSIYGREMLQSRWPWNYTNTIAA